MHVVSRETNKTYFSKYTSPQIGENQNCPTWVRSPLTAMAIVILLGLKMVVAKEGEASLIANYSILIREVNL